MQLPGNVRMEVGAAEADRIHMWSELALQKQLHDKWWQYHMAHLPEYAEKMDGVRGAESAVAAMRYDLERTHMEP